MLNQCVQKHVIYIWATRKINMSKIAASLKILLHFRISYNYLKYVLGYLQRRADTERTKFTDLLGHWFLGPCTSTMLLSV